MAKRVRLCGSSWIAGATTQPCIRWRRARSPPPPGSPSWARQARAPRRCSPPGGARPSAGGAPASRGMRERLRMRADRRDAVQRRTLRSRLWRTNRLVPPTMDSGVLKEQVERARDDAFGGVLDRHAQSARAGGRGPKHFVDAGAGHPRSNDGIEVGHAICLERRGRREITISRQIGATRCRPRAVWCYRPEAGDDLRFALQRNAAEPSRRLSSPTSCARPARRFSASNSRSTASICVRSKRAGPGVSAMARAVRRLFGLVGASGGRAVCGRACRPQ